MPMTFKPAYDQETVELLRTVLDQAWDALLPHYRDQTTSRTWPIVSSGMPQLANGIPPGCDPERLPTQFRRSLRPSRARLNESTTVCSTAKEPRRPSRIVASAAFAR
jgi:hypothetical protein